MNTKYRPDWRTDSKTCHKCGETRSVKYVLKSNGLDYCNMCAYYLALDDIEDPR